MNRSNETAIEIEDVIEFHQKKKGKLSSNDWDYSNMLELTSEKWNLTNNQLARVCSPHNLAICTFFDRWVAPKDAA